MDEEVIMKKLYPSFANPDTWRDNIKEEIIEEEWKKLRLEILKRDNYTCQYCGFKSEKWQIVHHIDGNPNNNKHDNLETICPMCNLIHHTGQGCVVQAIVDLYEKSGYSQNEIIQITRKMRIEGRSDKEIISHLGLKNKVPYKMNKDYLKKIFGFVTSRKTEGWTQKSLDYGYRTIVDNKTHVNYDKKQELNQLSYIGPKKYKKLVKAGIRTIKDLIDVDTQELNFKSGIQIRSIEKLKKNAEAIKSNKIIQVRPFNLPAGVIYFDIETDLWQSYIWMVGAYYQDKFYPFYSNSRKTDKDILQDFLRFLNKHPNSMLCYYSPKGFDRRLLIASFNEYGLKAEDFSKRKFLDLAVEIKSRFYLPTTFGLKDVSKALNYNFKYPDMDGFAAAHLYGEDSVKNKDKLIDYNKDDLLSMRYIIDVFNKGDIKNIKKDFEEGMFAEDVAGPIDEEKILELRNKGYTLQKIADMTGRSVTYIYSRVNKKYAPKYLKADIK